MLELLAWVSIGLALLCALVIAVDEARHPQHMGVMNVVWPVTGLYFSVFALWAYFTIGRKYTREAMHAIQQMRMESDTEAGAMHNGKGDPPTVSQVAVGTSHCGAGCMIADVFSEFGIAAAGITLLGSVLWADYAIDFAAAWLLGVVFQYYAIKPMREQLSTAGAIWAAIKADTLSILAFQVGMYLWMALVHFKLFPHLTPFNPVYWLMMQVGMICGFATSFPMNRVLIGVGLKEKM